MTEMINDIDMIGNIDRAFWENNMCCPFSGQSELNEVYCLQMLKLTICEMTILFVPVKYSPKLNKTFYM